MAKTIFEKIWDVHVVEHLEDGSDLLHIDRCYCHDLSGTMAYRMMNKNGYKPFHPALTVSIPDHTLASCPGRTIASSPVSETYMPAFRQLSEEMGIRMFDLGDPRQGVVHVVGPETGLSLPGITVVCGDSHTCTHGAIGAMAWGVGTSELYHAVTTQTVVARKPKLMRLQLEGTPGPAVEAMDIILYLIARFGAGFGAGYAVEYSGGAISEMEIEDRMTICNLTVEMGSEYAIIAPDDKTLTYLEEREFTPKGELFQKLKEYAKTLKNDEGTEFDVDMTVDISRVTPQISWGISPEQTISLTGSIPAVPVHGKEDAFRKALDYMNFRPGACMLGLPVQRVFIGSCSNGRLSNLQRVAQVVQGKHVAMGVEAWIVPGSMEVKRQAEALGLHQVFREAGFLWGEPGCSLCGGCNGERVAPGHRCVSTTNRNFMGRQGPKSQTHLASPTTAALAAIAGAIVDTENFAK
jgi:3-isopropylmalate/(R)-2-methylmalate dehydratase large subunit